MTKIEFDIRIQSQLKLSRPNSRISTKSHSGFRTPSSLHSRPETADFTRKSAQINCSQPPVSIQTPVEVSADISAYKEIQKLERQLFELNETTKVAAKQIEMPSRPIDQSKQSLDELLEESRPKQLQFQQILLRQPPSCHLSIESIFNSRKLLPSCEKTFGLTPEMETEMGKLFRIICSQQGSNFMRSQCYNTICLLDHAVGAIFDSDELKTLLFRTANGSQFANT